MPSADGAPACPFVAFDDDRDERATVPDHRHRCYAEVQPAPRALAHQQAYCLSSAFPVCPTFQDWARRESARARDAAAGAAAEAALATPETVLAAPASHSPPAAADTPDATPAADIAGADAHDRPDRSAPDEDVAEGDPHDDDGPRRNPPRDWSAPPPWLASAEAAGPGPSEPPDFLAGRSDPARGLAGSAADLLAGGSPPRPVPPSSPMPQSRLTPSNDLQPRPAQVPEFEEHDPPRPAVPAVPPRRPRAYDQHLGGPSGGPNWERPRRQEAYPTIRTRMSLPSIPPLAGMAAAVALAALALFLLPGLLRPGTDGEPGASPTPSPSPSRSIAPTPSPDPTPVVYTIKEGDTLIAIAVANGLTIEQLRAANPDIKDPNKIIVGQQITIPPPPSEIPDEFGGSASPSAAPSP
jgi:hypothetical protein